MDTNQHIRVKELDELTTIIAGLVREGIAFLCEWSCREECYIITITGF